MRAGGAAILLFAGLANAALGQEKAGDVAVEAADPRAPEEASHWRFTWQGWNGLEMEFVEVMHLPRFADLLGLPSASGAPRLHLEKVKLAANLGGKLEVDGAAFLTTGDLTGFDEGAELRRFRFYIGGDAVLLVPFQYQFEIGYSPNQFILEQSYILFSNIKYIGNLQFGQFQPPQGLQVITSEWAIPLMEPAAPMQAIAPGNQAGIQIGRPFAGNRATWAFGGFVPGTGSEYGDASKSLGSLMGRVTWLPIYRVDPAMPARILHLGLSGSVQVSASSDVRYQSRPESHIAPFVVDTEDIAASSGQTLGGEIAWVNGPLCLQGEYLLSFVGRTDGAGLHFGGYYAEASWLLTGESRPYDPNAAAFTAIVPKKNFDFGKTGWGALGVSVRYSYTDLNDEDVAGGRLRMLMTGASWYLRQQLKAMFNYGYGQVYGGPLGGGTVNIFQARLGVNF